MKRAIQVGNGFRKHTLKEVIESANTGDVIVIDPGEYNFPTGFLIKDITLRGNGKRPQDVVLNTAFSIEDYGKLKLTNLEVVGPQDYCTIFSSGTGAALELEKCIVKNSGDKVALFFNGKVDISIKSSEISGEIQLNGNEEAILANTIVDILELKGNSHADIYTGKITEWMGIGGKATLEANKLYFDKAAEQKVSFTTYSRGQAILKELNMPKGNNNANIYDESILDIESSNIDNQDVKLVFLKNSNSSQINATNVQYNMIEEQKPKTQDNGNFSNQSDFEKTNSSDGSDGFSSTDVKEETALDELHSLIGLTKVKDEIDGFISMAAFNKKRQEKGISGVKQSFHSLFLGNPGTGKTTVARLLAKAMYEEGVLASNHYIEADRSTLVGEYIGQTEKNTSEILHKALGGVLFVDEAYSLVGQGNDFGAKALDTILKFMEDHRDDIMIIFAGYPQEMDRLLSSNSGLRSRFPNVFHFEDYTPAEISEIGMKMLEKDSFRFNRQLYQEKVQKAYIDSNSYSNGRWIRNANEKLERIVAKRVMRDHSADIDLIEDSDIATMISELNKN